MVKLAKVKVPVATRPDILQFNPHIFWDPIPPWAALDPKVAQQINVIRLEHQREVNALQGKTLDKALSAVKAGG
ncbi:MAG: hypothetical protein HY244_09030 [Rhizobiales bacterium]|nr:hypothetical protein [Hyphomicrobiales bacterium]